MSYRQLNVEERTLITKRLEQGLSQAEIARRLERAASTVSRELARNHRALDARMYLNTEAHLLALRRRRTPRHCRRPGETALVRYVRAKLAKDWSPEIIAGRVQREHRKYARLRVSAETIYRWIYRDCQRGG